MRNRGNLKSSLSEKDVTVFDAVDSIGKRQSFRYIPFWEGEGRVESVFPILSHVIANNGDEGELDRRLKLRLVAFGENFSVHQAQYSFEGAVKSPYPRR